MENNVPGLLVGSEIHGFHTLQDLDVGNIMAEAGKRWLQPNEIHAILCNFKYFTINVKPMTLPKSGTIVLFDRKMLRNFRKDGHNWKKKKDGKTVKEAHEHLKVGNDERIHVYYARSQDNPAFVRRCYWLLDKMLENIVLVHYRDTQELQGSPAAPVDSATPVNSISNSSSVSESSGPWLLSEEHDSGANLAHYVGEKEEPGDNLMARNHEKRLRELNTLEWDELVTADPSSEGKFSYFKQHNASEPCLMNNPSQSIGESCLGNLVESTATMGVLTDPNSMGCNFTGFLETEGLQSRDSFGRWMNYIMTETDTSISAADAAFESSPSSGYQTSSHLTLDNQENSLLEPIFRITDIAPTWAYSTEETKILITGIFHERHPQQANSNLFCICGDLCVPAEATQAGVFRCFVPPHSPGLVSLCLSFDGHKPISQVANFEYRAPLHDIVLPPDETPNWEEFQFQIRLAFLLFSTSKCLDIASYEISSIEHKNAKKFALHTTNILRDWAYLLSSVEDNKASFLQAKDTVFELMLKNRLKDWILERVIARGKTSEYDIHGQGAIHLCAILGYTWAVQLFSWSGFSLDFRDKFGWTALHWAAYYGREKMVAKLLSAGAKPNLVTDPTSENPGGCTASDLASKKGHEGLAAYLAEKALVQHFKDMSLAGNVSGSLQTAADDTMPIPEDLSEEESYLKDSLAAYRTAADAAARIQAAFRQQSLKIRTKQVQSLNTGDEARNIVAVMKIQHAFRNYETKKRMAAAARIQYMFRTRKMRREFLNLRNQTLKIQAVFRGFQVRRQYRKVLWSVGVLEKALLRWRLKRRGLRGLHIEVVEATADPRQEGDTEEDFFRASRRQAEERLERSVVRVQAMFRSRKVQEEYRHMKMAHDEAKLEYDEMHSLDNDSEM